jgi:cytochrome c-type biogenesis protein CcmH
MAETAAAAGRPQRRVTPATIALVLAALIALAAIIYSATRGGGGSAQQGNVTSPTGAAPAQPKSPEEAISDLESRLAQNPDDPDGWRRLGWAYFELARGSQSDEVFRGGIARSAAAYRRAAELEPNNAENWSALGEVLQSAATEVSPQAEEAFRRAISIDPKDPRSRYFLAVQRDLRGEHRAAIDDWLALLRDTPAGAPWEQDLRRTIQQAAEKNRIDIAGRLPPPRPASPATQGIPGPTREQMEAARGIPPSQQEEMVKGMVDRLDARLRQNPRDERGWMMLMRSRMVQREDQAAAEALRSALSAFADDPAAQQRLRAAAAELGIPQG